MTVHYAYTTLDRYFTSLDKLVQSGESPDLIIMGQAELLRSRRKAISKICNRLPRRTATP